jgi:hypothetical protein
MNRTVAGAIIRDPYTRKYTGTVHSPIQLRWLSRSGKENCGVTCDKSQLTMSRALSNVSPLGVTIYPDLVYNKPCTSITQSMDRSIHIDGRYKLGEKLGSGSYGKYSTTLYMLFDALSLHYLGRVYQAREIGGQTVVVVKIAHSGIEANALKHEYHVLGQLSSYAGVPKALWLGREEELHVMVLESLGPSLEEHFDACGHKFSLITVALIAGQLVCYRAYDHVSGPDNHSVISFTEYSLASLHPP